MKIRKWEAGDIDKGLLEVLANLSEAREIPPSIYEKIMGAYDDRCGSYVVLVAEENGNIIGTATLIMNWKLLRGGVRYGRITDVATRPDREGQGIGSQLVRALLEVAVQEGCYKVTLNCNRKNVGWYERFGFREHGVAMRLDLQPQH